MNVNVSRAEMLDRSTAFPLLESKALLRFTLAAGLVLIDLAMLTCAFAIADTIRSGGFEALNSDALLGAFLPIYFISASTAGAYAGPVLLKRGETLKRGLAALLIAASVTAIAMFFLKSGMSVSRFQFGFGFLAASILLPTARCLFVSYASRRLRHSLYAVVELRDGVRSIARGETPSFDPSSFFDPANPTPESLDVLARLVAHADRVVVNCDESRREAWAHVLQSLNVHGEILIPSLGGVRPLGVESFMGATTVLVGRGPLNLGERAAKRLFDIAVSLGALFVLWPLLIAAAIAIKLDSPGPALFRQARIGRQNRLFYMVKFRSMHLVQCDAAGATSTLRGDARITRVGRFIRSTSIDELPQLFNVLLGSMSIVGPRPHAVSSTAEDRLFWEIDSRYWHRHACKPGLTGLAQVRGFRGSTTRIKDITDRLTSDLEYLARWSMWRDILILLQTVRVLWHRNAY